MTYNIIDHGEWESYTPVPGEVPENVPHFAQFARRKTDLVDWYVYIYPDVDPPPALRIDPNPKKALPTFTHRAAPIVVPLNFGSGNIKFAASWRPPINGYVVGPVTKDVTQIFPAYSIVCEITDYPGTESEAFAEFNGKAYDPATGEFTEPVPVNPPVTPIGVKIEELLSRIEKLETEITTLRGR